MTKEVLITINGQQLGEGDEPVVMVTPGTYHLDNGYHYIHYEENIEGSDGRTQNTIKISSNRIVLLKRGEQSSQMIFDSNSKEDAIYQTPFGRLDFVTDTSLIRIAEEEQRIMIQVEYALYADDDKLSDNRLTILIESK